MKSVERMGLPGHIAMEHRMRNDQTETNTQGFPDGTQSAENTAGAEQTHVPGNPDPGMPRGAAEPLDAEEFARLKREAQEEGQGDKNENR